jgi:transposase InsO family protein
VPYKIHTVLSDNGVQFTAPGNDASAAKENRKAIERKELFWAHGFELVCAQNDIDHRLTKPNHPWTNGQVERMNRTIKEAAVRRYYYQNHLQLRAHLEAFADAYNFAKRLKPLRRFTPYEHIVKCWTEDPNRFILDPTHLSPGLNT